MTIQRTITMINLLLIALGAYFGVGIFYRIIGQQVATLPIAGPTFATPSGSKPVGKQPFGHYRPILNRDLFQTQKTTKAPAPDKTVNMAGLENTKLKLKLWGTVSGVPEKAYAVIEDTQKREQNLYRVGDSIQNATVKIILREKVVLSVNGKDEILAMEEVKQSDSRLTAVRERPRTSGRSPSRAQRISLRRNMINEAMQDVSKLATQIAIRPYLEDGRPAGLSLNNIKPNSIFRRMGLRNGDILMGVDGQEIQSVDDALRLYNNLKSASNVSVKLKRRGRERTIDYNIR